MSAVKRRRKQETRGGESKRRKVEALGAALSSFGAVGSMQKVSATQFFLQRRPIPSLGKLRGLAPRGLLTSLQNLNQGRSADPGLCPVVPHDQAHFLHCHSPVGVH